MNCTDGVNGTDPGSTASSLIRGVKALDPAAWRQLAHVYGPLVYGWARRAGLRGEDAADIAQEVFRVVAARPQRLQYGRPGDTFRGWLWTITRNKVRDFWRGQATHPPAIGGSDAREILLLVPEEGGSSSLVPPDASLRRAVEIIRGEFEERSWQAFWRVTVEGRPPADVAAELGVSANAVYLARSRILRRFREVLSGGEIGSGDEPDRG
jgi:RNA polymerase sigma-70 factor (ECF subfamily)